MTNLIFILVGLFSIVATALDADWFINNWRARFFVNIFGRNGARIFYIVLGILLVVVGVI